MYIVLCGISASVEPLYLWGCFLVMEKELKVGTWFSGIGAPEMAIKELGVPHRNVMAAEWDKYAQQTYLANFTTEKMYSDVTEINCSEVEQLGLFIAGFPCQAFSLAGKRLGFEETRGTLFFNTAEFIKINQPACFILENVKGLLSHDRPKGSKAKYGRTFNTIINLLASTVNYQETMFPYEDNLGYNIHYMVLNSKRFGVPQNRERIFIVGIRPDLPNDFRFPIGWPLKTRLKDVLEKNVDEKYYLSDKIIQGFINHAKKHKEKGNGFSFEPILNTEDAIAKCITARIAKMGGDDTYIQEKTTENTIAKTISTREGQRNDNNFIQDPLIEPELKQVGQLPGFEQTGRVYSTDGISATIKANGGGLGAKSGLYEINDENPETDENDVICHNMQPRSPDRPSLKYSSGGHGHLQKEDGTTYCLDTGNTNAAEIKGSGRIRRLTPIECFRLQGFPDSYVKPCSNSQTYKQAGNSITVSVIKAVIQNLLHITPPTTNPQE